MWEIAGILGQSLDPIAGASGWAGAGILGLVLSWLLLKHLPDKDRQAAAKDATTQEIVADLLKAAAEDRERDRESRHEQAEKDRQTRAEMADNFQVTMSGYYLAAKEESDRQWKRAEEWVERSHLESRQALDTILKHCENEMQKISEAVRSEIRLAQRERGEHGHVG